MGHFEQAAVVWQQAVEFYQQQGDGFHQAIALTYLSLAQQQLGQWPEAEAAIARSLTLLTPENSNTVERLQLLSQALNTRGRLELMVGKPEVALTTWQQATDLYRQLGDEDGVTGSLLNQVQAMEATGLYRRACRTMLEVLQVAHSCNGTALPDIDSLLQTLEAQPDAGMRVLGLRSLGNVFRIIGNLSQSHEILQRALNVAEPLQSPQEISATLLSLGNTEHALYNQATDLYDRTRLESDRNHVVEQAQQALSHYREAIAQAATSPTTRTTYIQAQLQHLRLLIALQQWLQEHEGRAEATALQPQIQTQVSGLLPGSFDFLPPSRTRVYTQVNLAQSLMQLSTAPTPNTHPATPDTIPQLLTTALQQAEALQDKRAQSYVLGTLGHWYEQSGYQREQPEAWVEGQKLTESALGLAQAIQAWEIAYQWQWQLGRIYQIQGEPEQAIAYYRAAVETLKSVRANLQAIDTDVQFSFRDDVEPVYRELVELLLITDKDATVSQDHLKQVIQQIDALQLTELENFLRCNLTQSVAISETEVDPTAAVIYPIILETQLAVVLRLPQSDQLYLHSISLSKDDVEQQLNAWRQELEKFYFSRTGLSLSQQLYNWLIRPFQSALQESQVKTLIFVLDGSLRNVPMAALHDGQRFLIEEYAIALMPGLQLLEPKPLADVALNVLSFGLSEIRPNFPPHLDFSPLIHVETELSTIQAQVPGQALLNQGFTSSTLARLVGSLSIPVLHLATHGQFSSNLEDTFILAWDKRLAVNDLSSILQHRNENNLPPIELLVFSACKTADGDNRATLGLAGIAVQSGARSTIASLWFIDDEATAELMGQFYQELANRDSPVTKAEALRRAQLALLQTPEYRAPLYWSPYVLVGSWL
jgi:CHAT domain-containing protein